MKYFLSTVFSYRISGLLCFATNSSPQRSRSRKLHKLARKQIDNVWAEESTHEAINYVRDDSILNELAFVVAWAVEACSREPDGTELIR